MFLKELVDGALWQDAQDSFAELLGLPVLTLDIMGNVIFSSGQFPFFCQLVLKRGEKYCFKSRLEALRDLDAKGWRAFSCHAALTNVLCPIVFDGKMVGAFLCASMRPSNDVYADTVRTAQFIRVDSNELLDEMSKMKVYDDEHVHRVGKTLEVMASIIPSQARKSVERERSFKNVSFIHSFTKKIFSILDLTRLLETAVTALTSGLGVDDCSITLYDRTARSGEGDSQIKEAVEKSNFTQIRNTLSPVIIKDASEDFLLKEVTGIREFKKPVLSFPLAHEKNLVGIITLYPSGAVNAERIDQFSEVCDVLAACITNAKRFQSSHVSAITDPLTGLYNKGYFLEALKNELARADKYKRATSLIIFDIDHFKKYNDTYGHPAGDKLLKQLGALIKESEGAIDTACRYGGEEFAIILPETKQDHAYLLAEKLRMTIGNYPFDNRKVTASIGICTCLNSSVSPDTLISEADKALYRSKGNGRDRVSVRVIVDKNLNPIDIDDQEKLSKII